VFAIQLNCRKGKQIKPINEINDIFLGGNAGFSAIKSVCIHLVDVHNQATPNKQSIYTYDIWAHFECFRNLAAFLEIRPSIFP